MGIKIQAGNKFYGGISISTPSPYDDILDENSGWVTVSPSSGQDGVPNVEYIQNSSWGTVSYNKPDYNGLTTIRGGIEYPYTYYEFNPTKVATKQITGLVVGQTYSIDVEGQFFQSSSEYGSIYYSNSPRRYSKIVVGVTTADTTGLFKWADISPLLEAYYIQEVPNPSGGTNPTTNPMQSTSPVEFVATSSTYTVVLSKNTDHQFPIEKMDINMVPAPVARYYVVTAHRGDDGASGAGGAYVFDANDPSASPTKLLSPDAYQNQFLGMSSAASSKHIVLGTWRDDGGNSSDYSKGAAYVYDVNDLTATPTKLTALDGQGGDRFGWSVAASSDKIYVGASNDNNQGTATTDGAVYVYDANDLSATPTRIDPFDAQTYPGKSFGASVDVNSDHLFVGAYYGTTATDQAMGAVYVYDVNDLSATPTKLTAFDDNPGDNARYAQSLSASEDYLVVGAWRDTVGSDTVGSVYVYDLSDLSATPTKLTAFDGQGGDYFGYSIAVSSSYVFVGAKGDDDGSTPNSSYLNSSGSVYVYDLSDLSATPTKLTEPNAEPYAEFSRVAVFSDKLIIGAGGGGNTDTGTAYVYDLNDLSAAPTQLLAGDGESGDLFGESVSIVPKS